MPTVTVKVEVKSCGNTCPHYSYTPEGGYCDKAKMYTGNSHQKGFPFGCPINVRQILK